MNELEKVEKLREKTHVSYEEAKAALEACQWDILDAIVYLEKLGKIDESQYANYSTAYEPDASKNQYENAGKEQKGESFSQMCNRFFKWCGRLIMKGNESSMDIDRKGTRLISIPVTIVVLALLLWFWVIVPLMVVGLFFGFRYSFRGPISCVDINNAMDKMSEGVENLKNEVKR